MQKVLSFFLMRKNIAEVKKVILQSALFLLMAKHY